MRKCCGWDYVNKITTKGQEYVVYYYVVKYVYPNELVVINTVNEKSAYNYPWNILWGWLVVH